MRWRGHACIATIGPLGCVVLALYSLLFFRYVRGPESVLIASSLHPQQTKVSCANGGQAEKPSGCDRLSVQTGKTIFEKADDTQPLFNRLRLTLF
jgi:hypothetical protein